MLMVANGGNLLLIGESFDEKLQRLRSRWFSQRAYITSSRKDYAIKKELEARSWAGRAIA